MKTYIHKLFVPILNVLLVAIFPAMFLFCRNADEASFSEILPAIGIFSIIALIFFAILFFITKLAAHSAIISSILILILTNFVMLENLLKLCLPDLKYWHTVPIILFVGLHICYAVWRLVSKEFAVDISNVLCLVFGALILVKLELYHIPFFAFWIDKGKIFIKKLFFLTRLKFLICPSFLAFGVL